jgi:hypothetical protein
MPKVRIPPARKQLSAIADGQRSGVLHLTTTSGRRISDVGSGQRSITKYSLAFLVFLFVDFPSGKALLQDVEGVISSWGVTG